MRILAIASWLSFALFSNISAAITCRCKAEFNFGYANTRNMFIELTYDKNDIKKKRHEDFLIRYLKPKLFEKKVNILGSRQELLYDDSVIREADFTVAMPKMGAVKLVMLGDNDNLSSPSSVKKIFELIRVEIVNETLLPEKFFQTEEKYKSVIQTIRPWIIEAILENRMATQYQEVDMKKEPRNPTVIIETVQ